MRKFTLLTLLVLSAALFVGCKRTIWEHARNGKIKQVDAMLQENPELINAPHVDAIAGDKHNRWTPLHYAVHHQDRKMVAFLLENGADPLAKAKSDWTPYDEAQEQNNKKVTELIVTAIVQSGREVPQ